MVLEADVISCRLVVFGRFEFTTVMLTYLDSLVRRMGLWNAQKDARRPKNRSDVI